MFQRDIIVIGASAGGVEALTKLFSTLPSDLPAAIFVVLHLPAYARTELHEILGRQSKLRVSAATDGETFSLGHAYVAVADQHLMFEGNRIRLTRGPKENRVRPAIDVLFRSAAISFGSRVTGVVLSGMLDDGTAGLWTIKDRGGIAVVQLPEDALHPGMPESALRHVQIDHAVPVAEMSVVLTRSVQEGVARPEAPVPEPYYIENNIALEGNALQGGVLKLGEVSSNTCPECHGVLVRIRQGNIMRYRCHTGHSFSMRTLLADVNHEIDVTLWRAVRAIEERILLLKEMEENLEDIGAKNRSLALAKDAEKQANKLREILLSTSTLGHSL